LDCYLRFDAVPISEQEWNENTQSNELSWEEVLLNPLLWWKVSVRFFFHTVQVLNTVIRSMQQNSKPLRRWLMIISQFQQLVSLSSVSFWSPNISVLICEAHWRKTLSRWPYSPRCGYAVDCLRWCQGRFYSENMVIMAKKNSLLETVYIQCIKHIYT